MNEFELLIALNGIHGIGPVKICALLKKFGSAKEIFRANKNEILSTGGIGKLNFENLCKPPSREFVESQILKAEEMGAKIITYNCENYPPSLKKIYDPPIILHVLGDLPTSDEQTVGIVGTRNNSAYGTNVTQSFVSDLVARKIVIVSGLARGIDSIAHYTTIKKGGITLAVLGCGLDYFYPFNKKSLYSEIPEHGALISEFPFGSSPERGHFPRRNRIISGLSDALLVVEAGKRSGALITADFSMEHGVDVFAIPGNTTNLMSIGTNNLIKDGAAMATSASDILLALGQRPSAKKISTDENLNTTEKKVVKILSTEPIHIDEIVHKTKIDHALLHPILFSLEIKGVINQLNGMNYILH